MKKKAKVEQITLPLLTFVDLDVWPPRARENDSSSAGRDSPLT